ncbi:MAG: transporter substrate-binding domain-containing protein [Trichlorobacter sp.]|uniref:transporter substrate-binding domain-containing protein n=1 Tax=Trichlorobacter sp. TaxID=2911007 RepID=UPI0025636111|nr:transporter substrate-binding domain-containing protein [Trichlorobacter sp.]MDK9716680.1 transporter substrate-binding domain-containing protein [Trichlorobacter sp.]
MQRLRIPIIFLLLSLCFQVSAIAKTIIVGGDRDYPPYEFLDSNGKPAGYNVELTKAIAEVMGLQVEFRLGGWSEQLRDLKEGKIDLLQGISWSEQRATQIDFTPPHTIVNHAIFARKESPVVSSLAELKGKKVTLHRDGIMHEQLLRQGYGPDLLPTPTPADALRLLASGQCDYAVVAMVPGMYIIRENRLTNLVPVARSIASQKYGHAVRQGNGELLAKMTEGLAILKKTGQYDEIHAKWLGVLEPEGLAIGKAIKLAILVLAPLLLVLGGMAFWSRSLHKQVALRTADLTREVAERTAAEQELRRNQQQLVQADKMAALGVLVSGVAHEINNPNGLILLNMPILKDVCSDALAALEQQNQVELGGLAFKRIKDELPLMLDEMQDGARRIKRIVEDLKDFARQDDAALMEPLDLNQVSQAAVRLVDRSLRTATNRFEAEYTELLSPVLGNSQRIEQVLVNLLLNACQALTDTNRGIFLHTFIDETNTMAGVSVRDEGCGIAPEHLDRLTDPFFTTKRESGGTGLGLSVSTGIVKEHGGQLLFSSPPGQGTTVTLLLPINTEAVHHV